MSTSIEVLLCLLTAAFAAAVGWQVGRADAAREHRSLRAALRTQEQHLNELQHQLAEHAQKKASRKHRRREAARHIRAALGQADHTTNEPARLGAKETAGPGGSD